MSQCNNANRILILCLMFFVFPILVLAGENEVRPGDNYHKDYYFIEQGPIQKSTLYADGSVIELQTQSVTWPMIGSNLTNITPDEFKRMIDASRETMENNPNKIVVSGDGGRGGFDITFNVTNPPAGAIAALESVATYIEGLFNDTVTATININFAPLGPDILGATSCYYAGSPSWSTIRTAMINDMDGDDTLLNWLPSGVTIPVRYDYWTSTVTNEDKAYFTNANYTAAGIGTAGSLAASMTFNNLFTWDYVPRDGVTGFCFQSVATHEIGHCLGFVSGADFRNYDMEAMDIYRFQRTDGTGDYNPDDLSEFQTTARTVDKVNGSIADDANSDLIDIEYQMSDGNPYQCSHFSQGNVDANMQPAVSAGTTDYPNFYKIADRLVFDAIGWDYLLSYGLGVTITGSGTVVKFPDRNMYQPGTQVELTANPDAGYEFDHWSGGLTGSANPDTILMDDDKELIAHFLTLFCSLTVIINGNGTVLKNPDLPTYPRDTSVIMTADPDAGWYFHHWSGNLSGFQNPDTIVMNGNKTITAHFWVIQPVEENQGAGIQIPFVAVYPNPSSDKVTIEFGLNGQHNVDLRIYDVTGKLIRDFQVNQLSASVNQIYWDALDNAGKKVPNGIYLIRLVADDYRKITKLLMLK